MQRPSLLTVSIITGLGLGLVACSDDPPAPDEVRARISTDLASVLREANAAYAGGTEGMPGDAATAVVDRMLGTDSTVALRVRSAVARLTPSTSSSVNGGARPLDPEAEPYNPDAQIAYLNEKLFTDANHVGEGIYQVPPSLVCTETSIDASGGEVQTIDAECAAKLAEAQLRIRVSKDGDLIRFSLQVGADHDEPLTLGLEPSAISLTIDLDDAWRAAAALAKIYGEELPNAELAGQITGRLEILGAAHAKATLDIDRAISIAFAEAGAALDGPDAYRFSSAQAKVLALELDGAGKRGSYALGLGATAAHVLVDALTDTGTRRDRYELDLPGLTATATFAAGKPLELTRVSLGDRTASISKNGKTATAVDLNPADGRAFSATLTLDPATGRETLAVSPKLDLRIAVDHAAWGELAPVYDVTQILLDGSLRSDATVDRLEVLTGSFRISTNPATYGFSAAAGQCVAGDEVADVSTGDFYTQWTVGGCL
jgi:hypothetical protein